MTNTKSKIFLSSILLISLSILTINLIETSNSGIEYVDTDSPNSSFLSEDHITYPNTVVRVLEDFSVVLDLTGREPTAEIVNLTISYSNGTIKNYTMTKASLVFSTSVYIPANAPIGIQNFNLTVFASGPTKINETDGYLQFEILNSYPQGGIMLSDTEVYRTNTIYYNITPSDAEDSLEKLTWESKIMRVSSPDVAVAGTTHSNLLNDSFLFLSTYSNDYLGQHYIQLNVTDSDGNSTITRAYFIVKNNAPTIEEYSIEITNPDGTNLDSDKLLRISGEMKVEVNISDIDVVGGNIETAITQGTLKFKAIAYGSDGSILNLATLGSLEKNVGESDFRVTASIPSYASAVNYKLYLTVYENTIGDGIEYNSSQIYNFELINNMPNASKIELSINNEVPSVSGLKFYEYDDLVFNISVVDCDAEGIKLIRLVLINEDNEYLNFTFTNPSGESTDMLLFAMRAKDLASGTWIAHVYVIDEDGVEVASDKTISFDIKADIFSSVFPWIMLFVGIIIGAFGGIIVLLPKYLENKKDLENLTLGLDTKSVNSNEKRKSKNKSKSSNKRLEESKEIENVSEETPAPKPKSKKRKMTRKLN